MNKTRLTLICMTMAIFSTCLLGPVFADRGGDREKENEWKGSKNATSGGNYTESKNTATVERYKEDKNVRTRSNYQSRNPEDFKSQERYRQDKNYVFDKRYNHNRYYPKRGYTVPNLPNNFRKFKHRRDNYYFADGIWYRRAKVGFQVVLPPVGLRVSVLPPFYSTLWVNGMPYYYADGVYYIWQSEDRAYVVIDPPPDDKVETELDTPDKLFIYPKQGQSREQQATDRYECHRWSTGETGFDPTRPGGGVPDAEHASKRDDYQRAMKACLEARNYSVQ